MTTNLRSHAVIIAIALAYNGPMSEEPKWMGRGLLITELIAAIAFGALLLLWASQWPPSIRANNSIVGYFVICMLYFSIVAGVLNFGVWIRSRAANESRWKAAGMQALGMAFIMIAICLIPLLIAMSFAQY